MAILANYPNYSQQAAKINPGFDCVPCAIKDGVKFLTGQELDLDVMVTSVYGPNYHGATSASRYVEYCAGWGVHLYPIDGAPAALVQDVHSLIQEGRPCLLTEPDVYAPAHPEWSHVLSVYGEAPGSLTARDPFSTHDVTHSDADWAKILEYREIWVMERLEEQIMPLDISMPDVAALFRQLDATHWQSLKTGCILQDGFLANYKANGQASLDYLGDVVQNEIYIGGKPMQRYEKGVRFDDNNAYSSLPLYEGIGVDPLVAKLEAQITAMQSQPAAPQEYAAILQIKEIVGKF